MGTALITGASSGIGLEFAWQLAAARHNLVLVARDENRLNQHADRLRSAAGITVEVLPADLSHQTHIRRVADRLAATEQPIGLLINNAGYGGPLGFLETPLTESERALTVMVRAVMELSHAAAGPMTERGRGAICNISSVAAYMASGTYSAAKAWVLAFTEGLAVELSGTGVTATAVLPGLTRTEFHQRAQLDYSRIPDIAWLNPSDIVTQALADIRRGIVVSTPSVRYGLLGQIAKHTPRWLIRALSGPTR
jgi:short-subunit dehydrogenase